MATTMKLQVTLKPEKNDWGGYYPVHQGSGDRIIQDNRMVKEPRDRTLVVEFEASSEDRYPNHRLDSHFAELITAQNKNTITEILLENMKQVVKDSFGIWQYQGLMAALAWEWCPVRTFDPINHCFDLLGNQKGFGFMGGTGCGRLIHDLTFTKILGPKKGLKGPLAETAVYWFAAMLGTTKHLREETKHLRDAIKEEDLFVTVGAFPGCQRTVKNYHAIGYPVKGIKALEGMTCKKCRKAHGLKENT